MIPTRAALALPALLVLSGCGPVSATTLRTTTDVVASRDAAPHLAPPVAPSVPQSATPAPATAAPAPSRTELVATVPIGAGSEWLEILESVGPHDRENRDQPHARLDDRRRCRRRLLDSRTGSSTSSHRRAPFDRSVRCRRTRPASSSVPMARRYAYATEDQAASGSITNRIVVVVPVGGPRWWPTVSPTPIIRQPMRRRAGPITWSAGLRPGSHSQRCRRPGAAAARSTCRCSRRTRRHRSLVRKVSPP